MDGGGAKREAKARRGSRPNCLMKAAAASLEAGADFLPARPARSIGFATNRRKNRYYCERNAPPAQVSAGGSQPTT